MNENATCDCVFSSKNTKLVRERERETDMAVRRVDGLKRRTQEQRGWCI